MRSVLVRTAVFCGFFLMGSGLAWSQGAPAPSKAEPVPAAAEPSTVEQIWNAMEKSKLAYEVGVPRPVSHPVEEMTCSPRPTETRVVRSSEGDSLVSWAPSEKAKPHFEAAEKFFSEKRYSEAGEEYRKGLALDPDYGPGWLYSGDVPFHAGDYPAALTAYRKALALDPTLPMGHRFAADALMKMGRLDDAETEYVRALVYNPAYDGAWAGLENLGRLLAFTVKRPEFLPPADMLGERQGDKVQIALSEADQEWMGYVLCKAVWRNEDEYRRGKIGQKEAQKYSWSISEERECLIAYLQSNLNLTEARLEKEAAAKGQPKAGPSDEQLIAAAPENVRSLMEVAKAGLLDGFIAVAVLGKRCPTAASLLPEGIRADAEQYIRWFAIVRPSARKGN